MKYQMFDMKGLPNTKEMVSMPFVKTMHSANKCLQKYSCCTSAAEFGALNVWTNDNGNWQCGFYRHCCEINGQEFTLKKDVLKWLREWLPKTKGL